MLYNRCVTVISSFVGVNPVTNVRHSSVATKAHVDVSRPKMLGTNNGGMGGLDLNGMLVTLYRVYIRSKRYYLHRVFHMIGICIVNSWLLYRRHRPKMRIMPLANFRALIAEELISAGKPCETRKRSQPSSEESKATPKRRPVVARTVTDARMDGIEHWPRSGRKQRCKMCIVAYSTTKCEKYNVSLCLNKKKSCFKVFHTK